MSYLPHIWVYAGATCEDVYAELDATGDHTNLDLMSSPQLAFVAPAYSDDLVQKLAMDMWSEIQQLYEESFERGISFYELTAVMSAQVVERPHGFEGEMPVLEVTTWQYFFVHTGRTSCVVEPLMQVVVQKRPLRRLSTFEASA